MTEVTCHWLAPVRIGDTVRVELTFTAAQLTRSGTRGRVTERRVVLNQDDANRDRQPVDAPRRRPPVNVQGRGPR
jgi:acyl dehydratase